MAVMDMRVEGTPVVLFSSFMVVWKGIWPVPDCCCRPPIPIPPEVVAPPSEGVAAAVLPNAPPPNPTLLVPAPLNIEEEGCCVWPSELPNANPDA